MDLSPDFIKMYLKSTLEKGFKTGGKSIVQDIADSLSDDQLTTRSQTHLLRLVKLARGDARGTNGAYVRAIGRAKHLYAMITALRNVKFIGIRRQTHAPRRPELVVAVPMAAANRAHG